MLMKKILVLLQNITMIENNYILERIIVIIDVNKNKIKVILLVTIKTSLYELKIMFLLEALN